MGGLDWDDLDEQEAAKKDNPLPKPCDLPQLNILSWSMSASLQTVTQGVFPSQHIRVCKAIAASTAEVVCLQGFGCDRVVMDQLDTLGFEYHEIPFRRGSRDGVMVLWRTNSIRLSLRGELGGHGARCGALLMVLRDTRASEYGPRLAIMCTSIPNGSNQSVERDQLIRLREALEAMTTNLIHIPNVPVLFCGSFGNSMDPNVMGLMKEFGFQLVWELLHDEPCRVTHTNSRGENYASDHMWIRGRLDPKTLVLLPENVSDDAKLHHPQPTEIVSADGLPSSFEDWCELSDHRPLLGSFKWPEGTQNCHKRSEP